MNWAINFCLLNPWIHPDDATKAIHARLDESRKNRERVSEQVIIEDFFIASLVNNRPWNEGQAEQLRKFSEDITFCERLARAFATRKPPTWDEVDILILSNWRDLHINPEVQAVIEAQEGKLPGLRDWSPLAIEGFFALGKIEANCKSSFDDWFRKRRVRLGLRPNESYQIKKFIVKGDTIRIIR
jgi:hypothetical protein